MSSANKPERRVRAVEPEGQPDRQVVDEHGAASHAGRGGHLEEILGEFMGVAARLHEELDRRQEEAFRQNADLRLGPETDAEIEGLKRAAAATRKIVAALENLKRAIKARSDDLKWFRGLLGPSSRHLHES